MKPLFIVLALLVLGGCAGGPPPALPMPSLQAPRIAINKPQKAAPAAPLPQIPPTKPAPVWLVQQSDGNVASMLARWAKDAGWTVSWAADAPEISITGNGKVEKTDFLSAADFVITDAKSKGYAIKAKAFADKVLEIKKVDE